MAVQQDNKLDPEQEEYEKNFDFERHERDLAHTNANGPDNPAERAGMDRAGAWSRDNRPVAEREATPSWDTNLTGSRGRGGGSRGGGNRLNVGQMLKKRVNQWIAGGVVAFILSLSSLVPTALSSALVHLKTLASDWSNENNHSLFSKRSPIDFKKKYFDADPNCKEGVRCSLKTGVSDKEIDKLKKAGLNPEVGEKGDKKIIKSLNTTDLEGKPLKITADNFEEHYGSNVKFRGQMDKIAKPKSMLLRGSATLKLVFDKFGIKRNREISGEDDKERTKNFRADEYGEGNETEKANAAPDGGDQNKDETSKIAGVDDSINEAAKQERAALESSGFDRPPSIIPDTTNLDLTPDKAEGVANGLLKGGVKGAVLGVFAAIDKACSGYQLIRAATFGAKIYKVLSLVKYFGVIMTLIEKLRAGDSKADEIGYVGGILFKPSNKKDSYGKTFFQSEGFNLISQGKIADHRGLARFTTGSPFLKFLQGAKKLFENVGANKTTCKQVKSWYGQAALTIAGLGLDIFSGGGLSVGGVVAGAGIGMVVSVLQAYIVPLLVQYAAGTIAPDPTDPEGGYGAGNAFGAAAGAFGHFTGTANGAHLLTKNVATSVEMESNKEMSFMDKVDNYGKSPFDPDSDTSIPSQLALAVAPVAASPFSQGALQTMAAIVTSPLSLFGSSFNKIVTGGVNAQANINRGGEYCADEDYAAMDAAVDAFCNPIPGEKESTIKDARYDPQVVLNYMSPKTQDNPDGHDEVDDNGAPKSDDFKKYIASCVDSVAPLSPDGGGGDVGEDIDTRWCIDDTNEKFTMYRMYTLDQAWNTAHEASVNDTLGQETDATTTGSTAGTYENGKLPDSALCDLGSQWPGQRVLCGVDDKFAALNDAYKKAFGADISLTDSYRTYDQQVQCQKDKGNLCAEPGTSNHGCGLAIDFSGGINSFGTPQYNWMKANAGAYGWLHPAWAEPDGSKPEPWHWEWGTGGNTNGGTCTT